MTHHDRDLVPQGNNYDEDRDENNDTNDTETSAAGALVSLGFDEFLVRLLRTHGGRDNVVLDIICTQSWETARGVKTRRVGHVSIITISRTGSESKKIREGD